MREFFEPNMHELANGSIDKFIDEGKADIVTEYSEVIPMQIAALMLGASIEDVPKLRQWNRDSIDLMIETLEGQRMFDLCERMIEFDKFMRELIAERRENPPPTTSSRCSSTPRPRRANRPSTRAS